MPNLTTIKLEMLAVVKTVHFDLMDRVRMELDEMEFIDGLGQSNLETLYDFWNLYRNNKCERIDNSNNVNSWAAYALGLTSTKPEEDTELLPLRRAFARAGFPDIDSDFDPIKRELVFDYLVKKYGSEYTAHIGTYGTLNLRSAVRKIGKALDVADAFHKGSKEYTTENERKVSEILSSLPKQKGSVVKVYRAKGQVEVIDSVERAAEEFPDFSYYMDEHPGILDHSRNIEGLHSNFGVHAAGVVISDVPLERLTAVRRGSTTAKGSEIKMATQYTLEDIESCNLVKLDNLSLAVLTVIAKTLEMIEQNYDGLKIDLDHLPVDDDKAFDIYRSGNMFGVFQCEEKKMQETMQAIGVDRFEDIVVGIALYRPGPMNSIPSYVARKHGKEKIDYFHSSIEKYVKPYLESTYGILCYQEQVMQICNSLAGLTITDAYVMIKAIGKKIPELLAKYESQFLRGCVTNGVPEKIAQQYWSEKIVPFAGYGFNKAHSLCYGYNSYITAYLKANFLDEFMCAYLNVVSTRRNQDKVAILEKEARRMGIKILPRRLNDCELDYRVVAKKDSVTGVGQTLICPGLRCKGIGDGVAVHLAEKRPYRTMRELVQKTDGSIVTAESIAALYEGGYFKVTNTKDRQTNISYSEGDEGVEKIVHDYKILRSDQKKLGKKGVVSANMFGG